MSFRQVMDVILPPINGNRATVDGFFGEPRDNGPHGGTDFNYEDNTGGINSSKPKVYSPVSGTLEVSVGGIGTYGTVGIRASDGTYHQILHLDSRSVFKDPNGGVVNISAGQEIGAMGGRGPEGPRDYPPHVHYQIFTDTDRTARINPEQYWRDRDPNDFDRIPPDAHSVVSLIEDTIELTEGVYQTSITVGYYGGESTQFNVLANEHGDIIGVIPASPADLQVTTFGYEDDFHSTTPASANIYDPTTNTIIVVSNLGAGLVPQITTFDSHANQFSVGGGEITPESDDDLIHDPGAPVNPFSLEGIQAIFDQVLSNFVTEAMAEAASVRIDDYTDIISQQEQEALEWVNENANNDNVFQPDIGPDGFIDPEQFDNLPPPVQNLLASNGINPRPVQDSGDEGSETESDNEPGTEDPSSSDNNSGGGTTGTNPDIPSAGPPDSDDLPSDDDDDDDDSDSDSSDVGDIYDPGEYGLPIALDLDGDGVELTSINENNVFYDFDGDGSREATGWIAADDGILVYGANVDSNGDVVNAGDIELTNLMPGARTDLEGLRSQNTQRDNVFNNQDSSWNNFHVWQDLDEDGRQDKGELQSLASRGITSISLNSNNQSRVDSGNFVFGDGSFIRNGEERTLADVAFLINPNHTITDLDDSSIIFDNGTNRVFVAGETGRTIDMDIHNVGKAIGSNENDNIIANVNEAAYAFAGNGDDSLVGSNLNDHLLGAEGNDSIIGAAGRDLIEGGSGNDFLDGGTGADVLKGGEGNDTYIVDDTNDVITELVGEGTDQVESTVNYDLSENVENLNLVGNGNISGHGNDLDNLIEGNGGQNLILGAGGNDVLIGHGGNDLLLGGDGDDAINGGSGDDRLEGQAGVDILAGGSGDDIYIVENLLDQVVEIENEGEDSVESFVDRVLSENVENLNLVGSAISGTGNTLDNTVDGNAENNMLQGLAGNDLIFGREGDDNIHGGEGNDVIRGGDGADVLEGDAGNDQLFGSYANDLIRGGDGQDYLHGGFGSDTLQGGAGSDEIIGDYGHDILDGGEGDDLLIGEGGNDTYIVDSYGDVISELQDQGTDTIQTNLSYQLLDNFENLNLTGDDDLIATGNELDNAIFGNSGDNEIYGLAGNDDLQGGAGDDYLQGGAGADQLNGNEGDDILEGDAGDDKITGGDGQDNLVGAQGADILIGGNGDDILEGGVGEDNLSGDQGDDDLIGGRGNDILSGGAGSDHLFGNQGDDHLNGGEGADKLSGGRGNDYYYVDNSDDETIERRGEGVDKVISSIDHTLAENIELLTLVGFAQIGEGNELDNSIVGNNNGNILFGHGGDDSLQGGLGNDHLLGGEGGDFMLGGAGDDKYDVDSSSDQVIEVAGGGIDQVDSSIDYVLGQHLENLNLQGSAINGTGNEYDNIIVGSKLNNTLLGRSGDDVLLGLDGDDEIIGGEGRDDLQGGAGSDVLYGGTGIDFLSGGTGEDLLDGGVGADTMSGAQGDDTYLVDASKDIVLENAGEGHDQVNSTIDRQLAENAEDLRLLGEAIFGAGNNLDNVITGNALANNLYGAGGNDVLWGGLGNDLQKGGEGEDILRGGEGNDTLDGGTGADEMSGGSGDDNYFIDNERDVVNELDGQGRDHVSAVISYTLTKNTEDLSLIGNSLAGTGNRLDNVIIGNEHENILSGLSGDDYIEGGDGIDTLSGGEGDETFVMDSANDQVVEIGGEGIDTVIVRDNYELDKHIENAILSGTEDFSLTGSDDENSLTGNSGNNVIIGQRGDDRLHGKEGSDLLHAGRGDDIVFGGAGDDELYGERGDDLIVGGEGNDILRGGENNDTYQFDAGFGQDIIYESADQRGNYDTVQFGEGINPEDLWFSREGDDIVISVLGSDDQLTINDEEFNGNSNNIDEYSAGGEVLDKSDVTQLIDALAKYDLEDAESGSLSEEEQAQISSIIDSAWEEQVS